MCIILKNNRAGRNHTACTLCVYEMRFTLCFLYGDAFFHDKNLIGNIHHSLVVI